MSGKHKLKSEQNDHDLEDALKALKRRKTMLAAINELAIKLLSNERESLEDIMSYCLKSIAETAEVEQVAASRRFDEGSLDILQFTALIYASAIVREEMKHDIYDIEQTGNLTKKEITIVRLLAQNEGKVIKAETVYKKAWGQPLNGDKNALQVAIARLRKKIKPAGYNIVSLRGKGYMLEKR